MSEVKFEREPRYLVIKLSKLDGGYASGSLYPDAKLAKKIEDLAGSALVDCVVVEAGWPEYEPVWGMIEHRMTGQPASDFDAQRLRADTAEAELKGIKDGMAYRGSLFGKVQSERDDYERKLAAAEQRIAKFEDLLKDMRALPQKRCAAFIAQIIDVLDGPRAALNPNPEAESHE